ncbi:MAG: DUF1013 domain-containing protein, partial [Pseudomonadota bacterium]
QDPVGLGMCSQVELDTAVAKAAKARPEKVIQTEQPPEQETPDAPEETPSNEFAAAQKLGNLLSGDAS